jgi:hypothetical protein
MRYSYNKSSLREGKRKRFKTEEDSRWILGKKKTSSVCLSHSLSSVLLFRVLNFMVVGKGREVFGAYVTFFFFLSFSS